MTMHAQTTGKTFDTKADPQIRKLIDRFVEAVKQRDLDGVVADYAEDFVGFDLMPPLRIDRTKYQADWKMCFDSAVGPIDFEVGDLVIVGSGDCAFAYGLSHLTAQDHNGVKHDNYMRLSLGFAKRGNAWKVVHEHTSLPIDMSKQPPEPQFDLKP